MSDLKVHPRPGTPLYVSVREAVQSAIERGRYRPGEQLPSTKALAEMLGVSLVTVHRAMHELMTSGVLRRGQGRGTFVHEEYAARAGRATGVRAGIVLHPQASLADGWHGGVLEGVRRGAAEVGLDLVLLRYGEDSRQECQAYLLVDPAPEQLDHPLRFGRHARAPNDGLAVVAVGMRVGRPGWAAVDCDNAGMSRAAVQHLHRLGHRRLGYAGARGGRCGDAERWEGFVGQCERSGCEPITAGLPDMLRSDARPTAMVVAGESRVFEVFEAVRGAGLRIPDELSILALDEPPGASQLTPALTAFRSPLVEMGRAAVHQAFEVAAKGARPTPQTTLAVELVERASTAPPPAAR